jgi:AcrR family transcriptional regulator
VARSGPARTQRRPAGTRAFARGGFAATSLDDIAAEAGVARDTIYRNFDSKTDLYRAALEATLRAVQDRFLQVGAGRFGPEGIEALFAVARDNPDGFRLLFRHAAREPEFRELVDERQQAIATAAEASLRRILPDRAPPMGRPADASADRRGHHRLDGRRQPGPRARGGDRRRDTAEHDSIAPQDAVAPTWTNDEADNGTDPDGPTARSRP